MGGWKDLEEERLTQLNYAVGIIVAAKVAVRCEAHGTPIRNPDVDEKEAYKVGNAKLSRGEFKGIFTSSRQMTDAVKDALDDQIYESCGLCDKMLED